MDTPSTHVMTIANSIIGVSILAMPYCFKQCGIILSILMLILSSIISRLACHFLLKSAIKARLKTFEFLAYHAFGPFGKFIIEIGMIGFLLGTCIAFFVVMGDLGPQIVSRMIGLKTTSSVRTSVLVILAVFCILPLGLLRNVDSLSGVCTATIGFYMCLVLKIMGESAPHILVGDWYEKVEFWRTEGALQCIPIFSMALFCQTQLFEIYQAIPNASLERMNGLIRIAVNICTSVYIFVGIFGYIALANEPFSGNVLMSFRPSLMSEIIKVGFVLSVAFSFPLIIFPCRASLFSLLYKPTYVLHDSGTNYIPEGKFRLLTVIIVFVSLVIGLLIPNIELVLGLVGSTIGVMICVLFPATCFICMSTKNTNERILAQMMLFIGIIVMVLGTYANIYAIEEANWNAAAEKVNVVPLNVNANIMKSIEEHKVPVLDMPTPILGVAEIKNSNKNVEIIEDPAVLKEVRHEPPQPVEPEEVAAPVKPKEIPQPPESEAVVPEKVPQPVEPVVVAPEKQKEIPMVLEENEKKIPALDSGGVKVEEEKAELKPVDSEVQKIKISDTSQKTKENAEINRSEQVDIEAIKKEDKEIIQQEKEKDGGDYDKNLDLRDQISQLQKQNQVHQQIVQEQKKILEEIKQRQEALLSEQGQNEINKVKEEKLKAVKEIESIAKQAIKSLVDDKSLENQVNAKPALGTLESKILKDDTKNKEVVTVEFESVKANPKTDNTDVAKKPNVINQAEQNVSLTAQNVSIQQGKVIKLEDFIPIPIAKSNNISVFASMNLSNSNQSMKAASATSDENNKPSLPNQNLDSKLVESLALKISPNKPPSEELSPNKSPPEELSPNKPPPDELKSIAAKNEEKSENQLQNQSVDETVPKDEDSEKLKEKQQAMRRDILSQETQRLKRDTKESDAEICDKSGEENYHQNQYNKLDDSVRENETQKSAVNSVNQPSEQKDQGEICEKAESPSEDKNSFIKSEGKEAFNLNLDLNQHDLTKSILDGGSFNTFKNRKK